MLTGPLWHVCYVAPTRERYLVSEIRKKLTYESYSPSERLRRVVRGRWCIVERPLLPRYVFIRVDPDQPWQRLLDVDGVMDVLRNDNRPSCVRADWIEGIRQAELYGVFDRTRAEPNGFAIGERVRIAEGPFVGMDATIQGFAARFKSATAKKRVKLLMQYMGRASAIEMSVTQLEKL